MRFGIARAMEWILAVVGLICLATFAQMTGERAWFQWRDKQALKWPSAVNATPATNNPSDRRQSPLGRIEIPNWGISAVILDGADRRTLDRAVGHMPGTPYPGDAGRIVLAAHRDTFFWNLRWIKPGDVVRLVLSGKVEEYRVESTEVVAPERVDVLAPTRDRIVTLVTCYPFTYIGSAPQRFIVHARATNP